MIARIVPAAAMPHTPWLAVDCAILAAKDMGASAKLVYMALLSHCWRDATSAWPSVAVLSAKTGLGARTVNRAINELETARWLAVVRNGGSSSNRYTLLFGTLHPCHSGTPTPVNMTEPPLSFCPEAPVNMAHETYEVETDEMKDVSRDSSLDSANAPLLFVPRDGSTSVESEDTPPPPVPKTVASQPQREHLHKPKRVTKSAAETAAGKAAAASYYRVFEALAAAHGETAADAAPRRETACRQAKVALRALSESHPATAEDDLCDTIAWLGKKLKAQELHFLTVHYASQRVAEWRKVSAPPPEPVQKPLTPREQAEMDKIYEGYRKNPIWIAEQRTLAAFRAEKQAAVAAGMAP